MLRKDNIKTGTTEWQPNDISPLNCCGCEDEPSTGWAWWPYRVALSTRSTIEVNFGERKELKNIYVPVRSNFFSMAWTGLMVWCIGCEPVVCSCEVLEDIELPRTTIHNELWGNTRHIRSDVPCGWISSRLLLFCRWVRLPTCAKNCSYDHYGTKPDGYLVFNLFCYGSHDISNAIEMGFVWLKW